MRHHYVSNQCQRHKTCGLCLGQREKGKPHRCGVPACPRCKEFVDLCTHWCFIQPVEIPEDDEEHDEDTRPPLKPLFVYADIEALQETDWSFTPIIRVLCVEDCCVQFLHDLDDLTEVPDNDRPRPIIILFHNLKGFDGIPHPRTVQTNAQRWKHN